MQVPFQLAPLGVARLDDADAGGSQVVEVGEHLGLQPFILQGEPDGGADLALQVGQRCGMGDDRDPTAVPNQDGDRPSGSGDGLGDRPAVGIDMALGVRQPVGDPKLGIADGSGERRLEQNPGGGAWPRLVAIRATARRWTRMRTVAHTSPVARRITATHPVTKIARKAGSEGSSSGIRWSAIACAMVAAASRMAGRPTGSSTRRAGPESLRSRKAQTVTSAHRGSYGEPPIRHLDPVGKARDRPKEEHVVGAVGPAVGVEERVPEQGQAERDERGLQVDGGNQPTGGRAAQPAARVRDDQVEQQWEGESRDDHGEAPDQRSSLVPANPQRCEPGQTGQYGKVTDPPCPTG